MWSGIFLTGEVILGCACLRFWKMALTLLADTESVSWEARDWQFVYQVPKLF